MYLQGRRQPAHLKACASDANTAAAGRVAEVEGFSPGWSPSYVVPSSVPNAHRPLVQDTLEHVNMQLSQKFNRLISQVLIEFAAVPGL